MTGYIVADYLRLTDYKGAILQDTWKSASYLQSSEGFGNRDLLSSV
jgi:hypothetical protein